MRDDLQRRQDIQATERINRYAARGREAFEQDELIQNWVVNHCQIIGQASRGLSEAFRDEHANIPWRAIIGMRNILVHHYFGIDKDAVWSVVENDLASLEAEIRTILEHNADRS